MKRTVLFVTMISFLPLAICGNPAPLSAAPYYEGKVIQVIVGNAAGGGYDRMSRLLARYLPKYIPGKPTMVIRNMTGGGGFIAANYVYAAKPNGLTIGGLTRALGTSQIMKEPGVSYDFTKYMWIGSAASEPTALFIRANLPYKTFKEFAQAKRKFFFGSGGSGSHTRTIPLVFRDALGIDIDMVVYPGSTAVILLALERGELDGHYVSYSTYVPHIKSGLVRPLCRGRVSIPEIADLPVTESLVTDRKAKAILQIFSSVDLIARPYLAPPGTPENIMNILKDAFRKVEKDPDLMAEVEKNQMEFNYIPGPEAMKAVKEYMNLPKDVLDEFMKYSNL